MTKVVDVITATITIASITDANNCFINNGAANFGHYNCCSGQRWNKKFMIFFVVTAALVDAAATTTTTTTDASTVASYQCLLFTKKH